MKTRVRWSEFPKVWFVDWYRPTEPCRWVTFYGENFRFKFLAKRFAKKLSKFEDADQYTATVIAAENRGDYENGKKVIDKTNNSG